MRSSLRAAANFPGGTTCMKTSLFLGAAILFATIPTTLTGRAETAPASKPTTEAQTTAPNRKSGHSVPFRGKVASVDSQQMTFTLSGPKQRVFRMTPDTKIEKNGKTAAVADITPGDEARGLYQNGDDIELVVIKASFGPKPEASAKESKTSAKANKVEGGS
jgi:hypothetical protein